MENFSDSSSNFEKIKNKADSYGYNINYGRVVDNSRSDIIKILTAGAIVVAGIIYLRRKMSKLFCKVFRKSELRPVNKESSEKKSDDKNNRIISKNFSKNDAIDVEYTVWPNKEQANLYDSKHPDNIQNRYFKY